MCRREYHSGQGSQSSLGEDEHSGQGSQASQRCLKVVQRWSKGGPEVVQEEESRVIPDPLLVYYPDLLLPYSS